MASYQPITPIPKAAKILGIAGLAPFVPCAFALWVPVPFVSQFQVLSAATTYGSLILVFLGGIRWGAALGPIGERRQAIELCLSVVPVPIAVAAMALPHLLGLSLLVTGYLLMALWDVMSVEGRRLPQWFGRLRMALTAGAVVAMLAMLAKLFT
jgi:hypothetical protein